MGLDVIFPDNILDSLRSLYIAGAGQGNEDERRGYMRALVSVGLAYHVQNVLGNHTPRQPPEEVVLALVTGKIELEP